MKASMWMLHDELGQAVVDARLGNASKRRCLEGVALELQGELDDSLAYIVDATGCVSCAVPSTLAYVVIVGSNFAVPEQGSCQYIVLDEAVGVAGAVALVSRALGRFQRWHEGLLSVLADTRDLNRLCNVGAELLENTVMLHEKDHRVIAHSELSPEAAQVHGMRRQGAHYVTTPGMLRKMLDDPSFKKTYSARGAELYCHPDGDRAIYVNLGRGESYEGRLVVACDVRPFRQGDFQIAEILAEALRRAMRKGGVSRDDDLARVFRIYLVTLLEGHARENRRLQDSLSLWGWSRPGRYACFCVASASEDEATREYACAQIEAMRPGACAVAFRGRAAAVVALAEEERPEDVARSLAGGLRGIIGAIGASQPFRDPLEAGEYYTEAEVALDFGSAEAPAGDVHGFRDYAWRHFAKQATATLPAVHYYDSDVRRLMDYRGAQVDYYTTLKTYLEHNMNLLHTAEALHVHRTTLFKRLKKIETMLDADLDVPADRLRLILSFALVDECTKEG